MAKDWRLLRPLRRLTARAIDVWRARGTIRARRIEDVLRAERFREQNLAEIDRSGDILGTAGWFIRTEMTYSPVRDRYRAANSRLSPDTRLVNSGGDKMGFDRNGYATTYSRILARWIDHPTVLVELGAFRGSGLAIWSDLFPSGVVIGLDVELDHFAAGLPGLRARGAFSAGVPRVLRFDAYAPDVSELVEILGGRPIDVFIDDGPHKTEPSCRTAAMLRPLLSPEFTYVIEDRDGIPPCIAEVFEGCPIRQEAPGLVVITEG